METLKTLVIIGGGRGIGASTALIAARSGYRVALGFHEHYHLAENIVSKIKNTGGSACAFQLDVANLDSVETFFEQVVAVYGIPHAVAHCAGATGPRGALIDIEPEKIAGLLAVNLTGTFYSVQAAAKRMAISRGGCGGAIVTISSEAGRFGGNKISPYAASKAGINAMTSGVARELASEGIRLNTVSPGIIETDQQAFETEIRRTSLVSTIPMKRMGKPDEVANAILWLLSDNSSYVTGTVLTVAGGR
jgi:NAD(P)-dependent dehydrogenase (short-subunit alcohol dehydrogenase family)